MPTKTQGRRPRRSKFEIRERNQLVHRHLQQTEPKTRVQLTEELKLSMEDVYFALRQLQADGQVAKLKTGTRTPVWGALARPYVHCSDDGLAVVCERCARRTARRGSRVLPSAPGCADCGTVLADRRAP